ncbi:hypothetical protein, partial [Pseudomonas syringae group genomosp. 7]|uniref:hypothetical protein n=1 Tax=Pseudomonas syringae group genomosp. 7 TaxID=251699 RepID=UPI0037701D12
VAGRMGKAAPGEEGARDTNTMREIIGGGNILGEQKRRVFGGGEKDEERGRGRRKENKEWVWEEVEGG